MRCITLLTVLVLAMLAVHANAGKVVINGVCEDCNTPRPNEGKTTVKPSSSHAEHSRGHKHTDKDDSTESEEQIIGRFKRQWGNRQVIITDDGAGGGGGGGWSGGRVTTIDGNRYPGTVVRNDDCVGCNIRG